MIDPTLVARLVAGWRAIAAGRTPPRSGSPAGNRGMSRHPDLQSDD